MVDEAERVEEYENDAEEGNEEDESEDFDDSDEGELPEVGTCIVAAVQDTGQQLPQGVCLTLKCPCR